MTGSSRRLLWPAIMTAAMLLVLLVLGSWQVKRLFWKQALLAQIAQAEGARSIPLSQLEGEAAGGAKAKLPGAGGKPVTERPANG